MNIFVATNNVDALTQRADTSVEARRALLESPRPSPDRARAYRRWQSDYRRQDHATGRNSSMIFRSESKIWDLPPAKTAKLVRRAKRDVIAEALDDMALDVAEARAAALEAEARAEALEAEYSWDEYNDDHDRDYERDNREFDLDRDYDFGRNYNDGRQYDDLGGYDLDYRDRYGFESRSGYMYDEPFDRLPSYGRGACSEPCCFDYGSNEPSDPASLEDLDEYDAPEPPAQPELASVATVQPPPDRARAQRRRLRSRKQDHAAGRDWHSRQDKNPWISKNRPALVRRRAEHEVIAEEQSHADPANDCTPWVAFDPWAPALPEDAKRYSSVTEPPAGQHVWPRRVALVVSEYPGISFVDHDPSADQANDDLPEDLQYL